MSEMVERVAKAIYEADGVWSLAFPWPTMGSDGQSPDNYRRIARAAVEAMREPTEDMRFAGGNSIAYPSVYMGGPGEARMRAASQYYTAMIEAALE